MSMLLACMCGPLWDPVGTRVLVACKRCGHRRRVLLTVEQDAERRARGVSVEDWLAAPKVPTTRAGCVDGTRPCPHLRCRHHLGVRGDASCVLDGSDDDGQMTPRSHREIGAVFGLTREGARHVERKAVAKLRARARAGLASREHGQ